MDSSSPTPTLALGGGLLKIAFGALAVGLFAVIFATFGASESRADITWLSPDDRSPTDRFESALHDLGHDDVGTYDLNGNRVYFSSLTDGADPAVIARRYQQAMVDQGLNDEVFDGLQDERQRQRLRTGITGGLTPIAWSTDHIALAGAIPTNYAESDDELIENFAQADSRSDLFRGHRYIEISRQADASNTRIVATWSDGSFDLDRMVPNSDVQGQSFDPRFPTCPGCTRLMRFADDPDESRIELSYLSPQTPLETRRFYLSRLGEEGWQRHPLGAGLDRLTQLVDLPLPDGQSDRFHQGDQTLTVTYRNDPGSDQTLAHLSITDR